VASFVQRSLSGRFQWCNFKISGPLQESHLGSLLLAEDTSLAVHYKHSIQPHYVDT